LLFFFFPVDAAAAASPVGASAAADDDPAIGCSLELSSSLLDASSTTWRTASLTAAAAVWLSTGLDSSLMVVGVVAGR